jgi:hypothetical protein
MTIQNSASLEKWRKFSRNAMLSLTVFYVLCFGCLMFLYFQKSAIIPQTQMPIRFVGLVFTYLLGMSGLYGIYIFIRSKIARAA